MNLNFKMLRLAIVLSFLIMAAYANATSCGTAPSEEKWIWPAAYASQSGFTGNAYVLQLHVPKKGQPERRGPGPWPWQVEELHLVIRLERRPEPGLILEHYRKLKAAWRMHGVNVAGLQLDYDSPTAKVGLYASDLEKIRAKLPAGDELSITGLADWTRLDSLERLLKPHGVTVFFQLYRERQAHAEMTPILARLKKLKTAFKIGLLPGQKLSAPDLDRIKQNPHFKGIITFHGQGST